MLNRHTTSFRRMPGQWEASWLCKRPPDLPDAASGMFNRLRRTRSSLAFTMFALLAVLPQTFGAGLVVFAQSELRFVAPVIPSSRPSTPNPANPVGPVNSAEPQQVVRPLLPLSSTPRSPFAELTSGENREGRESRLIREILIDAAPPVDAATHRKPSESAPSLVPANAPVPGSDQTVAPGRGPVLHFSSSAAADTLENPLRHEVLRPIVPPLSPPCLSPAKPVREDVDTVRIDAIVRDAVLMEAEGRWSELLTHYESALRKYRNNATLRDKYRLARYRYDVVTRYGDASFHNLLLGCSVAENLVLFDEVIAKIQSNHIDAPRWDDMFRYGLDDLEIALEVPEFLEKNRLTAVRSTIPTFRKNLHAMVDNWQIADRDDMKNAVLHVAQLAQKELGLHPSAVLLEFLCGVADSLDPHTAFLTKNQHNEFLTVINGDFVGLGVELKSDRQSLIIFRVFTGSPAHQAGLRGGDRILAVDGQSTRGLDTNRAADLLQGAEGTTTRLQIQSPSAAPRLVDVRRQRVKVPSVEDVKMLNDYLGYLKLNCFQSTTTVEMREALWNLHNQGMRCLVVDLRHNPGGLLPESIAVANMFIDKGVIVSTRIHPQDPGTPYMATEAGTWPIPLVVLIDEESASAAEVFAGAIRDHGRGTIIGRQSYGKGTVQLVYALYGTNKSGSIAALRLTIEKFYSPSGVSCSGIGVSPDIVVDAPVPTLPAEIDEAANRQTVAKPIEGRIAAPITLAPSSASNDPYIVKAVETAARMMSTAATPATADQAKSL